MNINKFCEYCDLISRRIKTIYESDISLPQITIIKNIKSNIKGSQVEGDIKICFKEHNSDRDLFNTLIHELAHYYLNIKVQQEGIAVKPHCEEWKVLFIKILNEPGIWKGIPNKYIPWEGFGK